MRRSRPWGSSGTGHSGSRRTGSAGSWRWHRKRSNCCATLCGIARNVNQIARAANRTRAPDYRGFLEERAALGREIARLDARMQEVLDLAARRRDGLARLEAAAGGEGGLESGGDAGPAGNTGRADAVVASKRRKP